MTDLQYPVVIMKLSDEDGGGYLARALDLKGCFADGETAEEALSELKCAIAEWIDEAQRLEIDIPVPGTAIETATKRHLELIDIIKSQHELIMRQKNSFNHLRGELDKLDERVRLLQEKIEASDTSTSWWQIPTPGSAMIASIAVSRQKQHTH